MKLIPVKELLFSVASQHPEIHEWAVYERRRKNPLADALNNGYLWVPSENNVVGHIKAVLRDFFRATEVQVENTTPMCFKVTVIGKLNDKMGRKTVETFNLLRSFN